MRTQLASYSAGGGIVRAMSTVATDQASMLGLFSTCVEWSCTSNRSTATGQGMQARAAGAPPSCTAWQRLIRSIWGTSMMDPADKRAEMQLSVRGSIEGITRWPRESLQGAQRLK